MNSVHFSIPASVFHGKYLPEEGAIIGYGALIDYYQLEMPLPFSLSVISYKNRKYETNEWKVFTPIYKPEETLYKHLIFALKYEGVNLLFFKKLFNKINIDDIIACIQEEPAGIYSRKIWFLYEFLEQKRLPINDADVKIKYTTILDEKLQYALQKGQNSVRHRIINNLPGTVNFCPLIFKTKKLENYVKEDFTGKKQNYLQNIHKEVLQRASAFLLLKDSKASFSIEGESPKSKRAARWGQAIGQAGMREVDYNEFLRLQQIVIENPRFIQLGYRKKGGFVGMHDRTTGEPIPDHISSRPQDVDNLMNSLLETQKLLLKNNFDAVFAASIIAFGFVFIHPFEDGNGRIHRYLIHHILAKKQFAQQGIIFPVSSSILDHIDDYRKVLETFSLPLLEFIEWKETKDHNIEVLNETIDYYSYYDATKQAEFLYDCVNDTIQNIIPNEVDYLTKYDIFKKFIDDEYEVPDKMLALLVRFLEQGNGEISKRARAKEFEVFTDSEIKEIEKNFKEIMIEK